MSNTNDIANEITRLNVLSNAARVEAEAAFKSGDKPGAQAAEKKAAERASSPAERRESSAGRAHPCDR